jgi:hypothetical protein
MSRSSITEEAANVRSPLTRSFAKPKIEVLLFDTPENPAIVIDTENFWGTKWILTT